MLNLAKYKVQFFLFIFVLILLGTFVAIKFAKGYRIDFNLKTVVPNGILSANSNPIGANVLIDSKLKTATNNTLSLSPGEYQVEVKKPGFITWRKKLQIEKELVTFVDVFLFPEVPDLKPLTTTGALNPKISPDSTHLVYTIPLPFPEAGLWVIDLGDSFLFSRDPRQIAKSTSYLDLEKTQYHWSPNSQQIVLELPNKDQYLLNPYQLNSLTLLEEVTKTLPQFEEKWQKEADFNNAARYKKIPEELQTILKENASSITFSPDNTKILYIATASAQIPENLIPPVISSSTQKQDRQLLANQVYIYDIKEDRNFLIPFDQPQPTSTPNKTKEAPLIVEDNLPVWFPTSRHLVWINKEKKVVSCEYDGTNLQTIYSGSFIDPFVFASPSSNKIIILAEIDFSIEKNASPTPTTINIKSKITPTPTPQRPKTNLFTVSFR